MFLTLVVLCCLTLQTTQSSQIPPSCDSLIYCQGPLLHEVQLAEIFPDSKTFVDLKMLDEPNRILAKFSTLYEENNRSLTKNQLKTFVNENFVVADELQATHPKDFNPQPKFINRIKNKVIKQFATNLVAIWPNLTRTVKPEVVENVTRYSLIPLPNSFVIPGGRFRETYYWDSYWIIRGLLISEMYDTARGMLENFVFLIKKFGYIPNGSRIYYIRRTQPPLFTCMVMEYFKATKDIDWVRKNIQYLEIELKYWLRKKTIEVKVGKESYKLARYWSESLGPRPESYREDYYTAFGFEEKQRIYTDLKGAVESGWDFSTRWLYDVNGGTDTNLTDIFTRRTIPVDLNSFLYRAFKDLGNLYLGIGRPYDAFEWKINAEKMREAIQAVLWNEQDGIWYDYDLETGKHRKYFYMSNVTPLWVQAYSEDKFLADRVIKYLEVNKVFEYLGGTPTSLQQSGEQWDFPNAWPPLQAILVQGLNNLKSKHAKSKAKNLALKWVEANYLGYNNTHEMFEKYDAVVPGGYGEGGEYTVQSGFGWTNGVALEFIETYFTHGEFQ